MGVGMGVGKGMEHTSIMLSIVNIKYILLLLLNQILSR